MTARVSAVWASRTTKRSDRTRMTLTASISNSAKRFWGTNTATALLLPPPSAASEEDVGVAVAAPARENGRGAEEAVKSKLNCASLLLLAVLLFLRKAEVISPREAANDSALCGGGRSEAETVCDDKSTTLMGGLWGVGEEAAEVSSLWFQKDCDVAAPRLSSPTPPPPAAAFLAPKTPIDEAETIVYSGKGH